MTNVNFGEILQDVENTPDYSPLPDGEYDLTVVECTVKTTQTGKSMLALKTQVASGQYQRRLLWDNLVFSTDNKKAMGIIQGKLNALGLSPDYLKQNNPSLETIADVLVNRAFRAKVGQSEYQGKVRNDIRSYFPVSASPAAPAASMPPAPPVMAAGAAVAPPPPVAAPPVVPAGAPVGTSPF
jgi:hypothetical protein